MKHFCLSLIMVFLGISSIPVIAREGGGNIAYKGDTVQATHYHISRDRKGRVTVKNTVSGKVIRTFQMKEGIVREVFLLNGGRTVGASQNDHTIFWDLTTGREIRRFDQRIYGFSHDETRFFTYNREGLFLYAYAHLTRICELVKGPMLGPEAFLFSRDDRFLSILFASGRPASDENYPRADPVRIGIRYTKLFNIETCQEIQEFSRLDVIQLGEFSTDSRFYNLKDSGITVEGKRLTGSWRFDLTTTMVKKLPE